mmetsp:Transcript_7694/g.18129  ORF Transcript_7694/g.18129 Transcript_7694/m.18129 type:complete len:237 (-) Transcript_7694:135-845(-)
MAESQTEIRSFFKKRAKPAEDAQRAEEDSSKKAKHESDGHQPNETTKPDGVPETEPAVTPKGGHAPEKGEEETVAKNKSQSDTEHREVVEIKGDLFSCPKSASLAHCVSEDLRLGKGIAKLFRDKFGGVDEMRRQSVKVGGVAVIRRPGGGAYVYNLVTKEKFWQKPTYDSLRKSLQAMAAHMRAHDVREIAMPRIGCGLDGLTWGSVRAVINEVFQVGAAAGDAQGGLTISIYSI